ncbi:MAG: aldo/keto reductase [Sphingobacteriaceae bacterium]|nr:aldo/keto reductase [Sphingobacteriaceae bacterium]
MAIDKIILGTVQLGIEYGINNKQGRPSDFEGVGILRDAYLKGVRYIDTAEGYGKSHEVIGLYHRQHPNEKFQVITKFSLANLAKYSSFDWAFKNTLEILQVDSLAGYMFHDFADYVHNPEIRESMIVLRGLGKIQQLGVSVYTNDEAELVLDDPNINFIQIPFNLLDNFTKRGHVIEKARKAGKEVHTRSIFLQGLFYMKDVPIKLSALQPYLDQLRHIAAEEKVTLQDMALSFAVFHPCIAKILIGVESSVQLVSNLNSIKKGELAERLIDRINAIRVQEEELLNPVNW